MARKISRCSSCGMNGHNIRTCPIPEKTSNLKPKPKIRRQCSYCKGLIHRSLLVTIARDARKEKSRHLKDHTVYVPLRESFNHTRQKCPLRAYAVDNVAKEIARGWERKVARMARNGLGLGALYQISVANAKALTMITGIDWGVPEGGWNDNEPVNVRMCGTEIPSITLRVLRTGVEKRHILAHVYYTNVIARSPRPIEASEHISNPLLPWHRVVASKYHID